MFFENYEQKSQQLNRKIHELCLRIEKLDEDINAHFKEQCINPFEVVEYLENKDNFTKSEWAEIEEARRILDERLLIDLKKHTRSP